MTARSHVWRVLTILIIIAVSGAVTQRLLRPVGYGRTGDLITGNVGVQLKKDVVHVGKEACGECHDDIWNLHEKDIHFSVQCEVCHGPGNVHVNFQSGADTSITTEQATMPREYTLEGCLYCHRKLASRPRNYPQIDPIEHYSFLKVNDPKTRCIECHSPHEPIFLLQTVQESRIHPVIVECTQCHDTTPTQDHTTVKDHPTIFVCRDCHASIAADFKQNTHSFLKCTACHFFHLENEGAGRIFKNGNQRFCLLCHAVRPFRDKDAMPQIEAEAHMKEMAEQTGVDLAKTVDNPRACLLCHYDNIHHSEVIGKGGQKSAESR